MFKFSTRSAARSFKAKNTKYVVVDLGSNVQGKRCAIIFTEDIKEV